MVTRIAITLALLLGILSVDLARACTIAAISGRATYDGAPIIWKNRDVGNRDNVVVHDATGLYSYVGVTNAGDTSRVFQGMNSAGFAILNSDSYNLHDSLSTPFDDGHLMREVLRNCANVEEFLVYLDSTNVTGRDWCANYAVLDGAGRCGMAEVGNYRYMYDDANDVLVSPTGVVARANFSLSGDASPLPGMDRYTRACDLLTPAAATRSISPQYILQHVARDLGGLGLDPWIQTASAPAPIVNARNTIGRYISVSACIMQGPVPGAARDGGVIWAVLGSPLVSPAVPLWVQTDEVPWPLLGAPTAAWTDEARRLRDNVSATAGDMAHVNTALLRDPSGDGLWSRIAPIEAHLFSAVDSIRASARHRAPTALALAAAQSALVLGAWTQYQSLDLYPVSVPPSAHVATPRPTTPVVLSAAPHPFNHSTMLSAEWPSSGSPAHTTVRVLTSGGRLVNRWSVPEGTLKWSLRWIAQDENGRRLAAGTYWFVATSNREKVARALVVVD